MTLTLERRPQPDETTTGFHQSWFPLALADDVQAGQVIGRDFLGTRVILYRDATGRAVVQGAFCPHLGADLSVGQVVEGQIRCAYHHWRFDCAGTCVDIPAGDRIPPGARIPTYPSAEAWGLDLGVQRRSADLRGAGHSRSRGARAASTRRTSGAPARPIPGSPRRTASTSSICARCTASPRSTRTR